MVSRATVQNSRTRWSGELKRYFLCSGVELSLQEAILFSNMGAMVRWTKDPLPCPEAAGDGLPSSADLDAVIEEEQTRVLTSA